MATVLGAFLARGGFAGVLAGGGTEMGFGARVFCGGACLGASVFFEDLAALEALAGFFTIVFATAFAAFLTAFLALVFAALVFAALAFAPFFAFEVLLAPARAEVLRGFALFFVLLLAPFLALFFAAFLAVFFGRVATTNSLVVSNAIEEVRRKLIGYCLSMNVPGKDGTYFFRIMP
jgi:hypothetical protein